MCPGPAGGAAPLQAVARQTEGLSRVQGWVWWDVMTDYSFITEVWTGGMDPDEQLLIHPGLEEASCPFPASALTLLLLISCSLGRIEALLPIAVHFVTNTKGFCIGLGLKYFLLAFFMHVCMWGGMFACVSSHMCRCTCI